MFFPNLLWWIIVYFVRRKKCEIDLRKWIVASAVCLVAAPLLVILLFYGYTGALGEEWAAVDILLAFVCYFLAFLMARHDAKLVQFLQLLAALIISIASDDRFP